MPGDRRARRRGMIVGAAIAKNRSAKAAAPPTSTLPQAVAPAAESDMTKQLTELKGLLDSGILTQEEFDAKKKQILGI